MKTSNIIVTIVLVAASILFIWLWAWLGFSQVDSTLDIVIGVVWWAVIIAGIVAVVMAESNRRKKMRTVYLADGAFYNPEVGTHSLAADTSASAAIASTLAGLRYGFGTVAAPRQNGRPAQFRYVVRSSKFDAAAPGVDEHGRPHAGSWQGEVVNVATGKVQPFANRAELAAIIG